MPYNHYMQISKERYDLLSQRFQNYLLNVDDMSKEPIKLFDPLNAQQIQELELIREVSKDLQNKKEEDKKKATEAALAAEKAAKEKKEAENTEAETNGKEDNETENEIEKPTEVSSVED